MVLLVTAPHPEIVAYRERFPQSAGSIGRLLTPQHYPRARHTAAAGITWAADNDAFTGFKPDPFRAMLNTIAGLAGCLFVAVPDVVHQTDTGPMGDAPATLERFLEWEPIVRAHEAPAGARAPRRHDTQERAVGAHRRGVHRRQHPLQARR